MSDNSKGTGSAAAEVQTLADAAGAQYQQFLASDVVWVKPAIDVAPREES